VNNISRPDHSPPLRGTTVPLHGIRKAAARVMTSAWAAPMFHLSVDVDMTNALSLAGVRTERTLTDILSPRPPRR
jgi:pyruvate dehydrogenase E2 component (dihydrolipoamide acetyltransferase)